jgi:hypothetical protein
MATSASTLNSERVPRGNRLSMVRACLMLIASMIVGASLTVVIAWRCAWIAPEFAPGGQSFSGPALFNGDIVGFSVTDTRHSFGVRSLLLSPWHGAGFAVPAGSNLELHQEYLPSWSIAAPHQGDWRRDTSQANANLIAQELAFGWPWPTMVARVMGTTMQRMNDKPVDGIRVEAPPGTRSVFPMLLPTQPVWPGFLASTLVLSLPISGPVIFALLRRRWRRLEGRCVDCGYDLRGLTERICPECGPEPISPAKPA